MKQRDVARKPPVSIDRVFAERTNGGTADPALENVQSALSAAFDRLNGKLAPVLRQSVKEKDEATKAMDGGHCDTVRRLSCCAMRLGALNDRMSGTIDDLEV